MSFLLLLSLLLLLLLLLFRFFKSGSFRQSAEWKDKLFMENETLSSLSPLLLSSLSSLLFLCQWIGLRHIWRTKTWCQQTKEDLKKPTQSRFRFEMIFSRTRVDRKKNFQSNDLFFFFFFFHETSFSFFLSLTKKSATGVTVLFNLFYSVWSTACFAKLWSSGWDKWRFKVWPHFKWSMVTLDDQIFRNTQHLSILFDRQRFNEDWNDF